MGDMVVRSSKGCIHTTGARKPTDGVRGGGGERGECRSSVLI